jgi:hypothetical protein
MYRFASGRSNVAATTYQKHYPEGGRAMKRCLLACSVIICLIFASPAEALNVSEDFSAFTDGDYSLAKFNAEQEYWSISNVTEQSQLHIENEKMQLNPDGFDTGVFESEWTVNLDYSVSVMTLEFGGLYGGLTDPDLFAATAYNAEGEFISDWQNSHFQSTFDAETGIATLRIEGQNIRSVVFSDYNGQNFQAANIYWDNLFLEFEEGPDIPEIPEPGTLMLLGLGLFGLLVLRRKPKSR